MYELRQYSAGDLNALYYIAFKDYEEEVARKEAEEKKKAESKNSAERRRKTIEDLKRRGIRIPARALAEHHEAQRKKAEAPDLGLDIAGFQDLIDELE